MINTILRSRYKIIKQLGKGGFGETFIAEDLDMPTLPKPHCVVKYLHPDVINPDVIRLFEQEANILFNLGQHHDQIPTLNAYFYENNQFYLIQELIIGHDLSQEIITGKPWTESEGIKLLKDVLNVLSYVHENHVIHRDIKPKNIIRRKKDGKLFLIDFGAVKQVKQTVLKSGITTQTISIGTPGYMPSEQALGKPKYSSDIYALGIMVIQVLTGKLPTDLPEDENDEIIWRDLVNVSDKLGEILTKMVRFKASDRYPNAKEVLQVLNHQFFNIPLITAVPNIIQSPKLPIREYEQLEKFLIAKNWKEADQETGLIMLKIMNREQEGWLREEDCKNFPVKELKKIDDLWIKYSQGHFGFSMQKQIWIECGGKPGEYDHSIYCQMGVKLGWKVGKNWLSYSELDFNLNTEKGYLPRGVGNGLWLGVRWRISYIFSRL